MELYELKTTNFEPTTKYLESYTPPTDREKEQMFDDHVQDLLYELKLLNKKIGVVDNKCEELGEITDHFHDSTDKLEAIYLRDIEKKKQLYQNSLSNALVTTIDNSIIDLSSIDSIFDSIESSEHRSLLSILFYGHNLLMLGVIAFSGFVWTQMGQLGAKKRFD